jgi:D-arabinose 1-dehydrogenase-like Zn-dependent alcohol dehydrogenase
MAASGELELRSTMSAGKPKLDARSARKLPAQSQVVRVASLGCAGATYEDATCRAKNREHRDVMIWSLLLTCLK